jgi:hypothetical protein
MKQLRRRKNIARKSNRKSNYEGENNSEDEDMTLLIK